MTAIALKGEWLVDNGHRASGGTAPQRLITEQFLQALSGSQRFILDYLMEEVLERQPQKVRSFLLQTSVLDLLTGPLCETVTGQDDGQAMLDKMERKNLFIVSLDKERRWYRYHRLFADLLRRRVHQMQPEHVPILHCRASEWYEHHGLTAAAVEHALSAQDFERAARLIDGLADTLWQHSEHTTLSRWLEAMPEEVMRSRPGLCIFHACVLFMAGHHHAAEQRLWAAEATLGLTMALAPALGPGRVQDFSAAVQQGRVAAIRALLASFRGDVPTIIQFSRRALEVLPGEEAIWRGFVALALGTAHTFRGELAHARQAYSAAVAAGEAAGHTHLVLNATIRLALNQWHQGRLRQAGEICRQGLQLVEESGFSHSAAAGALYALWGQVLCEWNDLDNAMQYVQRGLEVSERGVSAGGLGFSYLALVRVLFAERRLAAAEDMIERLDKSVRGLDVPVWITSAIAAWKVWIWTVQGRLTAAQQLVRERGLSVTDDIVYPRAAEYVSLARLLIAQGELGAAIGLLECMLQSAEAESREGWTVQMLALRALALEARGDSAGAMDSLRRALDLAEPEGCVRVFVDEGPSMARLLYAAAARGIAPQYTGRLLATFPESDLVLSVTEPPKLQMIEPLSERELEVLQLIAEGLTNREIAQRLYLALSTVKVHTYKIYGKLGVHTRMQAVAKARALGVLPPS